MPVGTVPLQRTALNMPLSILMTTSFPIPGEYDGTAMLPIKIVRELKKNGVNVVLAHLKAKPAGGFRVERTEFEGIPSYTLPPSRWVGGLKQIQKLHHFDLVHAQHYGGATRCLPACLLHDWPLVYEIHSLLGDEVERDKLGRGLKFRATRFMEQAACNHAAEVIVLGEPVGEVCRTEKSVPADRIHTIYPGIDLGEYEHEVHPFEIPGIGPNHKVVMYIGSIVHPNQGVPLLIGALPAIFAADPDARCVLVGGPAPAGIEYQTRIAPYGDRLITITGTTPDQVVALSRRADVLVHPRLACRENYSVQSKIAVYLAAGRPIIATNFGDYKMLIGEKQSGLLVDVSPDAIATGVIDLLQNPSKAAALAANTRAVAEEYFAMSRNIQRYLNVYQSAIQRGNR
jgi:glycosyltransferase involved in cell wall biosynthesis